MEHLVVVVADAGPDPDSPGGVFAAAAEGGGWRLAAGEGAGRQVVVVQVREVVVVVVVEAWRARGWWRLDTGAGGRWRLARRRWRLDTGTSGWWRPEVVVVGVRDVIVIMVGVVDVIMVIVAGIDVALADVEAVDVRVGEGVDRVDGDERAEEELVQKHIDSDCWCWLLE